MYEFRTRTPELNVALDLIHGVEIERRLDALASFASGGPIGSGGTRLALSPEEREARVHLRTEMEGAGMQVEEYPLGLIGTYNGLQNDLPAIGIGSHFDTVPQAGKYDGTVGTISSIEVVRAFHQAGIQPLRPIKVFAFTGEESSRFNTALFGSRGMFLGLDDKTLDMRDTEGISMRKALEELGFNADSTKKPPITRKEIASFIELHVEQGPTLEQKRLDVVVINAIAAPDRRRIFIDNAKSQIEKEYIDDPYSSGIEVSIEGETGHSGTTPMGREYRADGLHIASDLLMVVPAAFKELFQAKGVKMYIGHVAIEGAALNKIPGKTAIEIFCSGNNKSSVEIARRFITDYMNKLNTYYGSDKYPKFKTNPISFSEISVPPEKQVFNSEQILPSFQAAGQIINWVDRICTQYSEDNIVGTIGTFSVADNGQLELKLDLRGIDKSKRDNVFNEIKTKIDKIDQDIGVRVSVSDPLPGSGEPTQMDEGIQEALLEAANALGYKVATIFSPAGHDTQNAVRAGIPGSMLFIPSRNEGKSHVPEEYSTPEDLEKGAKVLATAVYKLASRGK